MLDTNDVKLHDRAVSAAKAIERSVEQGAERVGGALAEFQDEALAFAKERPGTVLLAALALGFAVGRLVSRR